MQIPKTLKIIQEEDLYIDIGGELSATSDCKMISSRFYQFVEESTIKDGEAFLEVKLSINSGKRKPEEMNRGPPPKKHKPAANEESSDDESDDDNTEITLLQLSDLEKCEKLTFDDASIIVRHYKGKIFVTLKDFFEDTNRRLTMTRLSAKIDVKILVKEGNIYRYKKHKSDFGGYTHMVEINTLAKLVTHSDDVDLCKSIIDKINQR